ncbi:GNAT family N-acetyltransferase [Ornithinimicrobium cerasi]|uniref:L-amino acid N-acyltransferase YncA n=1 Tax=Ornithinimicrobium cerasi TaxID=2248773 RepID=A0A285VEJ2_9MICO|nr:GNAT family N-acetyltransferase [Ornithinimicrobium cerasi]SOC52522.1 L-amino acid N-acyltransferase YncA [Ornithinimicrobium cerasi]
MTTDHPHEHDHAAPTPGPLADAAVRTGRPSDAPAVGLVQAFVWQDAYADLLAREVLDQLTGPAFGRAWRRSLESPPTPRHRLLVATAGPQVVGYVSVGPAEEEPGLEEGVTGMIYDGGVHPQGRRGGHGSRLLNAAIDTLRAGTRGGVELANVVTWVLADAEGTRAFLQSAGFEPDGAWRDRVVDQDGRTAREVRLVAGL